jgi:hypothetical protein
MILLVATGHCLGGTTKLMLPILNPTSSDLHRASPTGRLNRGRFIYPVFKQNAQPRSCRRVSRAFNSRSSSSLWHTDNSRTRSMRPIVHETMVMISDDFRHCRLESGRHPRSNRELWSLATLQSFRSLAALSLSGSAASWRPGPGVLSRGAEPGSPASRRSSLVLLPRGGLIWFSYLGRHRICGSDFLQARGQPSLSKYYA